MGINMDSRGKMSDRRLTDKSPKRIMDNGYIPLDRFLREIKGSISVQLFFRVPLDVKVRYMTLPREVKKGVKMALIELIKEAYKSQKEFKEKNNININVNLNYNIATASAKIGMDPEIIARKNEKLEMENKELRELFEFWREKARNYDEVQRKLASIKNKIKTILALARDNTTPPEKQLNYIIKELEALAG